MSRQRPVPPAGAGLPPEDQPPAGAGRRRGRRSPPSPRRLLIAGVGAILAAVILGVLFVVSILHSGAPAPLSLPPANGIIGNTPPVHSPISGTWNVTPGSLAGFRVPEILFGQHHTAVGRTSKVTGGITISGTTVNAADFTVDMKSVTTDAAGRNVAFHDFILKTGSYPTARFRLVHPIPLGTPPPAEGKVLTEHAVGAFTLRGVTRNVDFTLKAERLAGNRIDINALIPIHFARWNIPNPSFAIAKVGSSGNIEVLLKLKRGAAAG